MKTFGIIVLPGSNCDSDCFYAVRDYLNQDAQYVWHEERNLDKYDVLMIPGGFSYGDYLRPGALARFSPAVDALVKEAEKGKLVVGICNGFQVLTELGLLPGALMRNKNLKRKYTFYVPVKDGAHKDGNYYVDEDTLQQLKKNGQVVLRYSEDVNGSVDRIAAVTNRQGNVVGMMPHPERACDPLLGSSDGMYILGSMLDHLLKGGF